MDKPFFISAPGKVIVYGEHSVVFGKPAIAAALSLRAYLLVTPNKDPDVITLEFPDIELSVSWHKSEIPFDIITPFIKRTTSGDLQPTKELVPEIVQELSKILGDKKSRFHYTACVSFLYLYVHLVDPDTPGKTYCVRSTVPIGAGLGSSACITVCMAAAMGLLGNHIKSPSIISTDSKLADDDQALDFIDSWSFMGEKVFHGNPSGIDNAVATRGGAVMYQRQEGGMPAIRTGIKNLPSMKLLLTNSKTPRSTATLVGNVGITNKAYPLIIGPILDAMGEVAKLAYQQMINPNDGQQSYKVLGDLFRINHGLLVAIGVSEPSLEDIKIVGDTHNIGITKLTGAGGGGCAITLLNNNVDESQIHKVIKIYDSKGYESYETLLGGKGVGAIFNNEFDLESFKTSTPQEIKAKLHINNENHWLYW